MSELVLDASTAAAWVLKGQATVRAGALLEHIEDFDLVAPHIFSLEIRSFLLKAERTRRADADDTQRALEQLETLAIELEPAWSHYELGSVMDIARAESLSIYDAQYLELALRRGSPLASRDGALLAAADRRGVEVLDVRP